MSIVKLVAIDGPSGSGKSTLAKQVAERLGILYIDTGAMYRALGLALHERGVELVESSKLETELKKIDFVYGKSSQELVIADGQNLTERIREHSVSDMASRVSKIPAVRDQLFSIQRSIGEKQISVMEGRDIGTVVFPDSFCKIFLTADIEARAQRRFDELKSRGQQHSLEDVLNDLKERDYRDTNRDVAPLKQATDAILIDSTKLSINDVEEKIVKLVEVRLRDSHISL